VNANIQVITPVSERASRYFFLTAMHRTLGGDAAVADILTRTTIAAFEEDKRMIEAQQRVIDRYPCRPLMPTTHDRAVTLYNLLRDRVLATEQQAA
jgi:vanillate O-demethylase monooxygenase subunit